MRAATKLNNESIMDVTSSSTMVGGSWPRGVAQVLWAARRSGSTATVTYL